MTIHTRPRALNDALAAALASGENATLYVTPLLFCRFVADVHRCSEAEAARFVSWKLEARRTGKVVTILAVQDIV